MGAQCSKHSGPDLHSKLYRLHPTYHHHELRLSETVHVIADLCIEEGEAGKDDGGVATSPRAQGHQLQLCIEAAGDLACCLHVAVLGLEGVDGCVVAKRDAVAVLRLDATALPATLRRDGEGWA